MLGFIRMYFVIVISFVHFRVSESKECKMPIDSLAKMFGPTIVGYSSDDLDPGSMFSETAQQAKVSSWTMI